MASPTTPTHGKIGNIYRLRPNGFKGAGLNDATWGVGYTGAATAYFTVAIDGVGTGTLNVDTFKWRVGTGLWTEEVDITGAAQALDDDQTITFASTTGHTAADQWMIGNLYEEATTEATATAQITTAANRILNPNRPPVFTDDGGETVLTLNYTNGYAVFTDEVGAVTVTGNNGYILQSMLEHVGYGFEWSMDAGLDMADASRFQQKWKEAVPGQAGVTGSFGSYYIGTKSMFDAFSDCADGTQKYFFVELYNYDPDGDQTGDRFLLWVTFSGFNVNASLGEVVKENLTFQALGAISQTANA